ncbi:hypothetical protein [Fructobacillus evanidus]|uniref:Uncharacterized protein n=1 Tax=Fructobacillus evanidus TaxID=3064281 RepID=A0ABN9YU64_9LACO|nr:unnamed protein product [Fructobacillus sp. LMG 32999]CAK1234659.1 unnamed protein product [Fructobacillus sp. LMG 32999]CAK1235754.1 unnamed protein product [Fructobacillus sp. LMG 32999]CAK1239391.1 unnamed protein product [Fructobacillus sp. LMG 32999]CAK1239854.1 unnamed protein product [Fructobacillus sp. LMG 32999]
MYWLINLPILFVISWVATTRLNQLKKITDKPKRKKLSLSFGALYISLGLIITFVSIIAHQSTWSTNGAFMVGFGIAVPLIIRKQQ